MNPVKGRQTEQYYSPGFIDPVDLISMKMSLESELRSISQAILRLKSELDELEKKVTP